MLLANAWCPSREQEWNRFAQEFACYYCRPLPERGLRFIRSNLQFSLEDHVPGIDSFVDVMDGHTRRCFPIREHPIEGFGPTVPWQQGGMDVNATQPRDINECSFQDSRKQSHNDKIHSELLHLLYEFSGVRTRAADHTQPARIA